MLDKCIVNVRVLDGGKFPTKAHDSDAGYDLYVRKKFENDKEVVCYLGVQLVIPTGHVGLLFPRSSIHKRDVRLANCVGVIDAGYRGELKAVFDKNGEYTYDVGERCCQLVILKLPDVILYRVSELISSDRGDKGFGSSGNR